MTSTNRPSPTRRLRRPTTDIGRWLSDMRIATFMPLNHPHNDPWASAKVAAAIHTASTDWHHHDTDEYTGVRAGLTSQRDTWAQLAHSPRALLDHAAPTLTTTWSDAHDEASVYNHATILLTFILRLFDLRFGPPQTTSRTSETAERQQNPTAPQVPDDRELQQVIAACADGDHELTDDESRIVADAYGHTERLHNWARGVPVAHLAQLAADVAELQDFAAIVRADHDRHHGYPPGAPNVLCALRRYFEHRAQHTQQPPTRDAYARELTALYHDELIHLSRIGTDPRITYTSPTDTALGADLTGGRHLLAVNTDGTLIGSHTTADPSPWTVGIYDNLTGHSHGHGTGPQLPDALGAAFASLARGTDTQ
ncbi:hypothetical protein [Nocardia wallacei]|uniref:hypothetical protein n=1 Tax=Nocardia wallacei TaxID=480035 RepID=UPI00245900EC|nr:hypothetical protein [Nocardia wallacei]